MQQTCVARIFSEFIKMVWDDPIGAVENNRINAPSSRAAAKSIMSVDIKLLDIELFYISSLD
jgi:hypothetical protein